MAEMKKILVLGASGLIGRHVTDDLRARGFTAIGVARRFSSSQKAGALDLEMRLLALDSTALARLIADHRIDVVVNCIGLLQDGPGGDVAAVHRDFVTRLLRAIRDGGRPSGSCISRSRARRLRTAPRSARPNAKPNG